MSGANHQHPSQYPTIAPDKTKQQPVISNMIQYDTNAQTKVFTVPIKVAYCDL